MKLWKAIILMIIAGYFISCETGSFDYEAPADFAIIFRTGFEPSEASGTPDNAHNEIRFENTAPFPTPQHIYIPRPAATNISYEGGRLMIDMHGSLKIPRRPATTFCTSG
jgi:hypothetical protein